MESGNREFDVVVFGASGFTGKYLAEYLAKVYEEEKLKWAIAGRSLDKLKEVLEDVKTITGKNVSEIPVIQADVGDLESLANMCKRTKMVLTTVGPYQFYGEPVVKACVENGSHYVDVSGEPLFLERMQLKYDEAARNAKVYIIGAAGFDSIPCEMGIQFLRQKFEGDVNSVESFLRFHTSSEGARINYGTWLSALNGLSNMKELKSIRAQLFTEPVPKSNHKLSPRGALFYDDDVKKWCIPLPVTDKTVVNRTQYYNFSHRNMRPIQMFTYLALPSLFYCIGAIAVAVFCGLMLKFKFGRSLLEKHPSFFTFGLFSKTGPTRKMVEGTTFSMILVGKGYPEKKADPSEQHSSPPGEKVIVVISGPEPGYITTPICMLQAALTVLKETDKLPKDGGVFTPGAALQDTSLISRLERSGLKFELRK